jgi:phosphoserine phosphatase RsbU/P
MNSAIPLQVMHADGPAILLGLLILIAGLLSFLLFLLRPRPRDAALLYFAISAGIYGLRLIAITKLIRDIFPGTFTFWDWVIWIVNYTIFIPFTFFFISTVARQWKRAEWWIIGIATGIAVFGISAHVLGSAVIAGTIYHIEVILYLPLLALMLLFPRRPVDRQLWIIRAGFLIAFVSAVYTNLVQLKLLPGRGDLEPLGFLVFLCCQAYVAAERTFRNEQRLAAISKELEIARNIQFGLLPDENVRVSGLEVAARYVPASSVAGDFYSFLVSDGRGLGVLVADVSGHGVPAALSASMVKVAIHAQAEHVQNPAQVLAGLNSILCGNLQGQFVTAAYVFIDVARRQLTYAGAGHPPLLLWRAREGKVQSLEQNGLMLGLFSGNDYNALACGFDAADRCLLYTDGLVEAPNAHGEEFGSERLQSFVASHSSSPPAVFCDDLIAQITNWSQNSRTHDLHDDMTLVVIDFNR